MYVGPGGRCHLFNCGLLTPLPGLVDGALVEVPDLLLVLGDGLDEHDGHAGVELLQLGLRDGAGVDVPPGSLGAGRSGGVTVGWSGLDWMERITSMKRPWV